MSYKNHKNLADFNRSVLRSEMLHCMYAHSRLGDSTKHHKQEKKTLTIVINVKSEGAT